ILRGTRSLCYFHQPTSGLAHVEKGENMEPVADQDAVLQVLYANFGCFALLTAHKLRIFKLFETESLTMAEAASRLGIPKRPMEILLTTLAAQRFLVKSGDRFALDALARDYLLENSPTYLGGCSTLPWLRIRC